MQVYNTDAEAFNFYQNGSWINFNNGAVLSVTGTTNQITATGSSSVVLSISSNPILPGTGGVTLPSGTTAQRPGSPNQGELRYNTDNHIAEGFINGSWVNFGSGFGSVTSITAGTNLTGGTITTTGTIALSATPTGLTSLGVGNLSLSSNQIISSNSNGNISLVPNGSGLVVLGAAGVSVDPSGLLITDTLTTFDANVIATGGSPGLLSFYDANNSNFVAFKSGDTVPSNVTWTLPSADGSNLQGIITNGTGTLSFTTLANRNATLIVQTSDASLPNAQSLIDLGAGLLKINASGVVQIAIPDTDYATEATLDSLVTEAEGFAATASAAATAASTSSGSAATSAVAAAASAAAAAVSAVSAASDASSVSGAASAKFIIQTTDSHRPNAQSLGALTTGLLKKTVTGSTGVLSTAVSGTDYGTVSSIIAGTNLTGGTITTTGTIALSATPSGLTSLGIGTVSPTRSLTVIGGQIVNLVESATDYTILDTDYLIGITDTSAPRTVTLPTASSDNKGQIYIVKDESGAALVNNITIDVNGGGNIDGAATSLIVTNYGDKNFYSNGTQWYTW